MKSVNWLRIAEVLRLADENGNMSLTNIVVMAALVRVLLAPAMSTPDLIALLGALTSYQSKRWMTPAPVPEAPAADVAAMQSSIESLQTKVTALQMSGQIKRQ